MSAREGLAAWHGYMDGGDNPQRLRDLLSDTAIFYSPVVHTPQEGRDKVFGYLYAASHVLGDEHFRYVREIIDGDQAVLEFVTELDGIQINGVDIIQWDEQGKIADFKVMIRPLKAINKVWEKMAAMLAKQAG